MDPSQDAIIYVSSTDDEVSGPFSVRELDALWKAESLPADSLYWHRGMVGWSPVGSFKPPNPDVLKTAQTMIVLTTAPTVAFRNVTRELHIVSAECVIGMNVFRDIAAAARDFFGGRSGAWQKQLRQAKEACLNELRQEAHSYDADAVIGVDLDYSEIGGQGMSMLMLVASGTAVRLTDVPPPIS